MKIKKLMKKVLMSSIVEGDLQNLSVGTLNKSARDEWLKNVLAGIPKGQSILDAGAGELRYKPLCSHLEYTSQDFAQYDGKGNNKGLQSGQFDNSKIDIVSDITSIPVANNSFDSIMCVEVFEHLPQPMEAIKEFQRILKKDGNLILTAPFASFTHMAPYHYYTGFTRYFYEKLFSENGFSILEISFNGNFFEFLAQELRRLPDMVNKYALPGDLESMDFNAVNHILENLEKFSTHDKGSNEFSCFGLHVLAQKL
jgi:ubiquinone/menaquinone biosynthesis C-methylase UbiE